MHRTSHRSDYPWIQSESLSSIKAFYDPVKGHQVGIEIERENPVAIGKSFVMDIRTDGINAGIVDTPFSPAIVFARHPRASDDRYETARDMVTLEGIMISLEIGCGPFPPRPFSAEQMETYMVFDPEMIRISPRES